MGVLIWHDWARLLALTSAFSVGWAAIWAFFYRKFFWDFVGATLGPGGLVPPPSAAIFVKIIVDFPVLQVINLVNALVTLGLEWPLPPVARLKIHGSMSFRVALYIWCTGAACELALPQTRASRPATISDTWTCSPAAFVYQTAFPALFYLVAAMAYGRALAKGETIASEHKPAASPRPVKV
ncbi:uncharacterized protein RHOBADRAFT_56477 [Rhodotorula graminis WP1]|uniref:DUF7727 domain-containing protein n=1 Tax=Rhodotorula graminis (strain WP1) TaxID=578459 RepID=A0A0P9GFR4_RHOGW|nr:uncharacterized protein RHOBADRAFT_56477 [Rhodotorula graminis WP1]KPV71639.1 hypothetical protein RHOBADRAFT_56477 [Rhodotorula graminis WP1]